MQIVWTLSPVTEANQPNENKLPIGGFCVVSTAQLRCMIWAHGPVVASLELAQPSIRHCCREESTAARQGGSECHIIQKHRTICYTMFIKAETLESDTDQGSNADSVPH